LVIPKHKGIYTSTNLYYAFAEIDGDLFVAQALTFLVAGYESSASTMSFSLYELAMHPEIQQSLRAEILQVLSEQDGQLTYDSMRDMSYLERVVSGEGQNRLNKNLRVKGLGFDDINCNIACCAFICHKVF
jgi:cytochrome P450 family 6